MKETADRSKRPTLNNILVCFIKNRLNFADNRLYYKGMSKIYKHLIWQLKYDFRPVYGPRS